MSKPLRLTLKKVTCQTEQSFEPGDDEMYLIAFGITGGGRRLFVPPTSIGSYHSDEVHQGTFPKPLIDLSVDDGETIAALCFWLFERDQGGLAQSGAALEASFNTTLNNYLTLDAPLNLSPLAVHLYALAQTMMDLRFSLEVMAYSLINSDELLLPRFHHLIAAQPQPHPGGGTGFQIQIGADGLYLLDFEFQFRRELVVVA